MCNKNSKQIIASLNRIAGQVRGVGQMVEDERYCIDILNQIHAVKAALSKVENQVLRSHAACCVEEAIASSTQQAACDRSTWFSTFERAALTAWIWLRMSMQYRSSSTI